MRIRLYSAFASNNSGGYVLVGSFRDVAKAEEAGRLLAEICAAHSIYYLQSTGVNSTPSPLEAFAVAQGISPAAIADVNTYDAWPEHGPPPEVMVVGGQVVVYVNYTVTMPTALGEFLYRAGGRVDTELDHTHHAVVTVFTLHAGTWDKPHVAALEALRADIDVMVAEQRVREDYVGRVWIPPAWQPGDYGTVLFAAVFWDLASGVREVCRLAKEHGVTVHISVKQGEGGGVDPLAIYRLRRTSAGFHRVALWQAGPNRVAMLKALREVLGCDVAQARALLETIPCELLTYVDVATANSAVETLLAAGADVEAMGPERFR